MSSPATRYQGSARIPRMTHALYNAVARRLYALVLVAATVVYVAVWSYISIARFYSLHAYVFDAGLFMQALYDVYTVHWTAYSLFQGVTYSGLEFVLAPLALPQSYPVLFISQSVAIGLGGPLVYLIAGRCGIGRATSLLLAISYLLFFPLAGANFFDLHVATFFPLFILLGYYLYLRGNLKLSLISFILAAIADYPLSLVVALFTACVLLDTLRVHSWNPSRLLGSHEGKVFVPALGFSVAWFLTRYLFLFATIGRTVPNTIHVVGYHATGATVLDILITLVLMLGPFLFLPLLSLRTLPAFIGYVGIAMFSTLPGYSYPYGFTSFYLYLWTPFVFIGVSDVLASGGYVRSVSRALRYVAGSRIWRHSGSKGVTEPQSGGTYSASRGLRKQSVDRFVPVGLSMILILALFFEPFGPFNGTVDGTGFRLQARTAVNVTAFEDVERLMATIPSDDPYVVIQNGLPEFFPRDFSGLGYDPLKQPGILLVPGVGGGLRWNLTYQTDSGAWEPVRIDYVVADPYQSTYNEVDPSPYNLSMSSLVRELYNSGHYGLRSEIDGMFVLQANYTGPLVTFSAFDQGFVANSLVSEYHDGITVQVDNISTGPHQYRTLWKTPPVALSPGLYEVNVTTRYLAPYSNNSTVQIILSLSGSTILNATTYTIRPDNLGIPDNWTVLHYFVDVRSFWSAATVFCQIAPNQVWKGALDVSDVHIAQVGPPTQVSQWIFEAPSLTSGYVSGSVVAVENTSTGAGEYVVIWKTPSIVLSPGMYEANVTARYLAPYSNNSTVQIILSLSGSTTLNATTYTIHPDGLGTPGVWTSIYEEVPATAGASDFVIFAQLPPSDAWPGTLEFESVSVTSI
jgi:uncharacterized membrane protein